MTTSIEELSESRKMNLKKLTFEQIGDWTWASGPKEAFTPEVCAWFRKEGYHYSVKKQAWYHTGIHADEDEKQYDARYPTLPDVREAWGLPEGGYHE